jgi:signal transduction histidine kinase
MRAARKTYLRTWLICFLLGLGQTTWVNAQNVQLIDSLRRLLPTADPALKFNLLNGIGFEYRYSYPDSTIFFCQQAYTLGQSVGLPKELSKPLSFMGLAKANQGDYTASFSFHLQAVEVAADQQDSLQLGHSHNNLGRLFYDQGDYVRAYDNSIKARIVFERLNDHSGMAYVYRSLANIYKSQNEWPQAIDMNTRALDLHKKLKDKRTLASAYMELGLTYEGAREYAEAKRLLLMADSVVQGYSDPVTKVEIGLALAELLFKEGATAAAAEKADRVLQTVTRQTNQKLYYRALLLKARYLLDQRTFTQAEEYLKQIYAASKATNNLALQRDAVFYLIQVSNRGGRATEAQQNRDEYEFLSEKLQNSNLMRQIDKLEFQLEIEKIERENALLKANNEANQQLIRNQRLQKVLLVIVVFFISALAGLVLWNSRRNRLIGRKLAEQNSFIYQQRDEIQQQNEELLSSNEQLQALDQEKTTLMNIVAHDLKTPLNRILGLTQLMELDGDVGKQQLEYLQMLKKSTQAGLDLITDLLDVNEIEAKKQPHLERVDIATICRERKTHYEMLAGPKNIQLVFTGSVQSVVLTDPAYLVRILDNLVTNAIKFSPAGSQVRLGSEHVDQHLVVTVEDQGPGFSDEDRRFLFQKFRKLSARPTAGESSNGLGLAIIKILVDRLQGSIELKSQPGKGSTFIVTLPAKS